MCRRVYFIGLSLWLFAFQLPSARADSTNQDQYLTIYVKMHDAENLEKQGDFAGALEGFKDCYNRLSKLHQKDPDWEKALVVHRMEDCKVTIQKLQAQVGDNPPPTPPSPPPRSTIPTPPPVVPQNPATNTTVPPLQTDSSANLPNDVATLKKQLQSVELELKITKESLKNSQNEVDAYRGQLQTVNAQLQAVKNKQSVDDKVGRLLAENKTLTDKLTQAQKQIDDLKSVNPKSKVALMQTQLKNLQDQFDESQASNKALQSTITTLQQNLDHAQAELVNANQRLADAGTNNPEYQTIKHENEVMRAILTREIQEQAHRDMAKRLYQEEFDNLKIKSKVLQEQLDILASPMTPASTDDERALLASLKVQGPGITPPPNPSNVLSTPNTATTTTTTTPDTGTNATPASSTPMAPNATNAPSATLPATIASNNVATQATNPPASTDPAPVNIPPTTPPAPDTNTAPAPTNVNPVPAVPDNTPTTPPITPPAPPANNTPAPAAPDTTAPPTTTQLPPPTTTITDTTVTHPASPPDATQYSTKARLPEDMRDTAQQAADLFKMKRYDEAAAKYQAIIDKYPESLYAWSNLGVVRYQQGDLDDALKALQQAVKLSPTDSFSYANLGIVYYEMKQYENAIDALNAAKALDPKDAKVCNYLGCACSQKGWQEAAEKDFLKAIELDPNFGDAHFNLALVYATQKPPLIEMARKEYRKAQELGIAKDDRLEKLLQENPSKP